MRYQLHYACISHIGKIRSMNQDNFSCLGQYMDPDKPPLTFPLCGTISTKEPVLFGVFDGMGGEEHGEIASYLAAKEAAETPLADDSVETLLSYCKKANDAICAYTAQNQVTSMGTTAAMLLVHKNTITLCNVGDSKVFRLSPEDWRQISEDHVAAAPFGKKPPLSQNLGIPPNLLTIEPFLSRGLCSHGDRYLICSDGLTDMVSMEEIKEILQEPLDQAATHLVETALANGGKDNITVMVLEVVRDRNKLFAFLNK